MVVWCSASCQKAYLGKLKKNRIPPLLIIMGFESGGGGLAANSYATSGELAVRNVKILNNNTLTSFDPLHIGVNNLVNHVGLNYAQNDAHGWELGVANKYDDGVFPGRNVYICKIAQGGTTVSMWSEGNSYSAESQTVFPYTVAIARIQAALHLIDSLETLPPDIVMWSSLGVNDAGIGTTPTDFKNGYINLLNDFRSDIGIDFPIIMSQFQGINPVYDVVISQIPSSVSGTYYINTASYETTQVVAGPGYHFGYSGMKQMAYDLITLTLSIL